jgi:hypothetical protein
MIAGHVAAITSSAPAMSQRPRSEARCQVRASSWPAAVEEACGNAGIGPLRRCRLTAIFAVHSLGDRAVFSLSLMWRP